LDQATEEIRPAPADRLIAPVEPRLQTVATATARSYCPQAPGHSRGFHGNLDGDGPWLYEGLAAYHQEVLRARTGLLPEADAWRGLHQGFERGRMGTRPGTDLGAASSDMLRRRSFMRVYWSGAAIALLADLELRRAGGGGRSLDLALFELRRQHGPFDRAWDAWELIEALDGVTRSQVCSTLARRWLSADRFPDLR
jgi:predicted metalloprotease with PDZ domain